MSAFDPRAEEWFYVANRQQSGPVSLAELLDLHAKGKAGGGISADSHVWCAAMIEWKRLKDVPEVLQLLNQQQREQPQQQAQVQAEPKPPTAPASVPQSVVPSSAVRGSVSAAAAAPRTIPAGAAGAGAKFAPAAGRASGVASNPPAVSGGRNSAGGKHSGIRNWLNGWLPSRAAPRDLVKRGIVRNDALRPAVGVSGQPDAASPHALFGNDLAVILARPDTVGGIPRLVTTLMECLRADECAGLRNEGIFRVPGDSTEMQGLRGRINAGDDATELLRSCGNPHSVAGLLKMFYREIRPPLLGFSLYDEFIACSARLGAPSADKEPDCSELHALLQQLPPGHLELLSHLVAFLVEVVRFTPESKMTAGNTAAVFAPNLLRPEHETLEHLADTAHIVNLIACFITHAPRIFGADASAAAATATRLSAATQQLSAASLRHTSSSSLSLGMGRDSAASARGSIDRMPADHPPRLGAHSSDELQLSSSRCGSSGGLIAPPSSQPSQLSAQTTCSSCSLHADSFIGGGPVDLEPGPEPQAPSPQQLPSAESVVARGWYWVDAQNEQQGPVSWLELQQMLSAGQIHTQTYLFSEGMADWMALDLSGPEPGLTPPTVEAQLSGSAASWSSA